MSDSTVTEGKFQIQGNGINDFGEEILKTSQTLYPDSMSNKIHRTNN